MAKTRKSAPTIKGPTRNQARIAAAKAAFLKALDAEDDPDLNKCLKTAGIADRTRYEYMENDSEFKVAVEKRLKVQNNQVRRRKFRDILWGKIRTGLATAAEEIFYACNRWPDEWQNVSMIRTQSEGGAIDRLTAMWEKEQDAGSPDK